MQGFVMVYNHIFSPTTMVMMRAGVSRIRIWSKSPNTGVNNAAIAMGFPCNALTCVNLSNPTTDGIPSAEYDSGYSPQGDDAFVPLDTRDTTYQYNFALHHTHGAHSFKWGVQLIRRQLTEIQSNYPRGDMEFTGATALGNSLAEMLAGEVPSFQRIYTIVPSALRGWEPSAYMVDDWHATRNLTLNLGVRYDVYTAYTIANNAASNFDPALQLLVGPAFTGVQHSNPHVGMSTDYADIGPRVGFAYKMSHDLVVRGGFGISYFTGNYGSGSTFRNAPYAYGVRCGPATGLTCPAGFAGTNFGGYNFQNGILTPRFDWALATNRANYASFLVQDPNNKSSYAKQWSLQIEKEFSGNVFSIGYVGVFDSRLMIRPYTNQLPFPANLGGTYPYPLVPGVAMQSQNSIGNARYHALQSSLVRRFKAGLTGQVSYTWSHETSNSPILDEADVGYGTCWGACHIDNGIPGGYNVATWDKYDYGPYDADMTHQIRMAATYQIPWGNSLKGVEAGIAKGWSVVGSYSYNTGFPFSVQNGNNAQGNIQGGQNDRPNAIHNPNISNRTANHWFDTAAFALQQFGTLGNAGRNNVYGPAQQALNFSLWKDFPIRESIKLQFRCETFNLLNTPSFGYPNRTLGQSNFGVITQTTPNAYQREIQFALKLVF